MRHVAVVLTLVLSFHVGKVSGLLTGSRNHARILAECLSKYSWVADGDVCTFIGAEDYKHGTCGPKQRVARAYASHKVLNCVMGVKSE